jgi:hypothetical protein
MSTCDRYRPDRGCVLAVPSFRLRASNNVSQPVRERAMALIRGRARGTDFEAFTQRLWLEDRAVAKRRPREACRLTSACSWRARQVKGT